MRGSMVSRTKTTVDIRDELVIEAVCGRSAASDRRSRWRCRALTRLMGKRGAGFVGGGREGQ